MSCHVRLYVNGYIARIRESDSRFFLEVFVATGARLADRALACSSLADAQQKADFVVRSDGGPWLSLATT
jgi:hypothetical protein